MKILIENVRYSVRVLRKSPGFTTVSILTLALGIGACTALFSVIDTVLLRALPYQSPEQLVTVTETLPGMGTDEIGVAAGEYQDYRSQNRSFSQVAAYESEGFNLTGMGQPLRINAAKISASAFPLLGVSPVLGRPFTEEEDRSGGSQVVVLSYGLWRRSYSADPNILGKTLKLDERPYTVIGVMPGSFRFPFDGAPLSEMADLWLPMAFNPSRLAPENRTNEFGVGLIGRLSPGVTLIQAQKDVDGIANRFMEQYGYSGTIRVVPKVYPFAQHTTQKARPLLWLVALAVACVLLVACANVANLLLARTRHRQHEMAIRSAIGASHSRVLSQGLAESVVLSLAGASLGVLLAEACVLGLRHYGPVDVPRLHDVSLHAPALLFTVAVSLISALGFGFVPAWRLSQAAPVAALRESRQAGPGRTTERLQHSVAVFEMATAVVLLVTGGLLLKSFVRLLSSPAGFDPESAYVVRTLFDRARYPDPEKRKAVQLELLDRLEHVPGVTAVAAASHLPLSDERQIGFRLEHAAADEFHWAQNSLVGPGYFRAMGIPLLEGRDFSQDDRPDTTSVAIISETMAKQFFPGMNPIGQRFHWGDRALFTIIGVAADVHISALSADPPPMIYNSMFQVESGASGRTAFVLRTAAGIEGIFAAVQRQIWSVDQDLPIYNSTTLATLVSESVAQRRFSVLLLGTFAIIALLLAAIGLFGVISCFVGERTKEFGVRMALGADRIRIYRQVLARATILGLAGCLLGLCISVLISRALESMLYHVARFDWTTMVVVPLVLLSAALVAAYWPAHRATRVDPMVALRYE
jgi:predicted permease